MVLRGHEGAVTACAWSPDSRFILSASADGTLRRWDAASGKEIAAIHFAEDGWASLDWENNRILQVQGDAWRYLGWLAPDPQTGELIRLPAETFGALPEFVEPPRA